MKTVLAFGAGFVSGWAVRSTVDGFRPFAVGVVAGALDAAGRIKRMAAFERERLEDLVAEARAQIERRTRRAPQRPAAAAQPVHQNGVS